VVVCVVIIMAFGLAFIDVFFNWFFGTVIRLY